MTKLGTVIPNLQNLSMTSPTEFYDVTQIILIPTFVEVTGGKPRGGLLAPPPTSPVILNIVKNSKP